jgi:DNA-binding transcriptional ArsR family regulator
LAGWLGCTASVVGGEGGSRSRVYKEREEIVLIAEGSDTKLRIIRRLNLLVRQPFLYICVRQYTIVMVEITI